MFVEELEVVNACLATLGEAPLNTLEDDHSYKAAAQAKLKTANLDVQKQGYWFNTEYLTLLPDAVSKYVYLPLDVIEARPMQYRGLSIAQRGRRLYNTMSNTYEFDDSVCVQVVRGLDFADLPYHAAAAVRDEAVLHFQHEFDGDATRYRELFNVRMQSRSQLNAEDVRQRRPNLLNSNTMRRLLADMEYPLSAGLLPSQLRTS